MVDLPVVDESTLETALSAVEQAASAASPAGRFYQHLDSQQITIYVPPNSSRQAWQVRGVEPNSGIVFLSIINNNAFHEAGYVKTHMNRLGACLYDESLVADVVGIGVRQVQDAQNQLKNELDVTVQSTSGDSTGRITVPYPNPADKAGSVAAFTKLVQAEVKLLDANEAS
jgi:hypothetical protein